MSCIRTYLPKPRHLLASSPHSQNSVLVEMAKVVCDVSMLGEALKFHTKWVPILSEQYLELLSVEFGAVEQSVNTTLQSKLSCGVRVARRTINESCLIFYFQSKDIMLFNQKITFFPKSSVLHRVPIVWNMIMLYMC